MSGCRWDAARLPCPSGKISPIAGRGTSAQASLASPRGEGPGLEVSRRGARASPRRWHSSLACSRAAGEMCAPRSSSGGKTACEPLVLPSPCWQKASGSDGKATLYARIVNAPHPLFANILHYLRYSSSMTSIQLRIRYMRPFRASLTNIYSYGTTVHMSIITWASRAPCQITAEARAPCQNKPVKTGPSNYRQGSGPCYPPLEWKGLPTHDMQDRPVHPSYPVR